MVTLGIASPEDRLPDTGDVYDIETLVQQRLDKEHQQLVTSEISGNSKKS